MNRIERVERIAWVLGLVATLGALVVCGLELRTGFAPPTSDILEFVGSASCGLVWIAGAILFIVSILSTPLPRHQRYRTLALFIALAVAGTFVVVRGWYVVTDGLVAWRNHHDPYPRDGWSFGGADFNYDHGFYEEASRGYSKAIRLYPNWAEAYYKRGMCYHQLGSYEEAIADFEEAARLDPGLGWAFYGLGDTYAELGQYEEAIRSYSEAIRLDPDVAGLYVSRAAAYYEQGQYSEAVSDCDVALSLSPKYRQAYLTRAFALHALSDHEGAIRDYTAALSINPSYHEVHYDRGCAFASLGRYEEAVADYSEAIRLNPHYASAYCDRGLVYQEQGRMDEALKDFESCLESATDDERLRSEAEAHIDRMRQH